MIFNLFKKKSSVLLALDIGTEFVKAVFFEKEGGRSEVISVFAEKIEKRGELDSHNYERDVLKSAVLGAIKKSEREAVLSDAKSEIKEKICNGRKNVILTFSPKFLKTEIFRKNVLRVNAGKKISKKEEETIIRDSLNEAKGKIEANFSKNCGIFPENIVWVSSDVTEKKVDGHSFVALSGKTGSEVEINVFISYLQNGYLEEIKSILEAYGNYQILRISHLADSIAFLPKTGKNNSIYLDIGGDFTQAFIVKDNKIKNIFSFQGGNYFTNAVAYGLGMEENIAEKIKNNYSNFSLERSSEEKVEKIIRQQSLAFFENLNRLTTQESGHDIFDSDIYLFGGGANLEDIKNVIEQEVVRFSGNVKIVYSDDVKNIKNTRIPRNPQFVPAVLVCFS